MVVTGYCGGARGVQVGSLCSAWDESSEVAIVGVVEEAVGVDLGHLGMIDKP